MTLKNIYIYILLIFLLYPAYITLAGNSLPYSYSESEILEGGKLFINKNQISNEIQSFFFKPNFYDNSEVLYIWDGIERKNVKGTLFPNGYVLSAHQYKDGLFAVWSSGQGIYAGIIDSSALVVTETMLMDESLGYDQNVNVEIGFLVEHDAFIVHIAGLLFSCNISEGYINHEILATQVHSFDISKESEFDFSYVIIKEGSGLVYNAHINGKHIFACRIPVFENVVIRSIRDKVFSITYPNNTANSIVRVIDNTNGVISEFNPEETGNMIEFSMDSTKTTIIYFSRNGNNYALFKSELINHKEFKNIYISDIPAYFIEPMALKVSKDLIILLFRNGIVSFNIKGKIQSSEIFPLGEYFNKGIEMFSINDILIVKGNNTAIIFKKNYNSLWMLEGFLETTGKAIIPIVLIILIIIFIQLYRHQKRLLSAVLNLPSSGIVFVIDKNGCLSRANSSGKKILGITNNIPLGKPFQYYCVFEQTKGINELVQNSILLRETITQKISINESDKDSKEWYCTALSLHNIAGQFRGIVFTGIDITEELERKRLSNWAQLAHDMQTNLSTIKLNAEQLELDSIDKNFERRRKILHQTYLLIQRVRDIVTVGRTDSLGMQVVNSAEICVDVRNEFDETLFPDIEFKMNSKSFKVFCDKAKIIRALRNAVENAIKSMPDSKGCVMISCRNDTRYAYFSIKDTGTGMDQKAIDRMMIPYFSTAKDKGGYGIGTMIMQHVMDIHAGKFTIQSKKGFGTEIIFTFPNTK